MAKKKRYPLSDHCKGKLFFNVCGKVRRLKEGLKWWLYERRPIPWPKHLNNRQRKFHKVEDTHYHVTFIGHATLLIQFAGMSILTDPIWSKTCAPIISKRLRRVTNPGLKIGDVPKIDLILLSHNHYDHCDRATLKYFRKRDNPLIVTGLGNAALLNRLHFNEIVELDWWESITFKGKKITFVPAQHFSGRWPFDYNKSLWGGFVVGDGNKTLYFAADTGYCEHFKEIKDRFHRIDLACLPIGAYKPKKLMELVHMCPEEALMAHKVLYAKKSIGIHFGCFHLTDEGYDEPVRTLKETLYRNGIDSSEFLTLKEGEGIEF